MIPAPCCQPPLHCLTSLHRVVTNRRHANASGRHPEPAHPRLSLRPQACSSKRAYDLFYTSNILEMYIFYNNESCRIFRLFCCLRLAYYLPHPYTLRSSSQAYRIFPLLFSLDLFLLLRIYKHVENAETIETGNLSQRPQQGCTKVHLWIDQSPEKKKKDHHCQNRARSALLVRSQHNQAETVSW